MYTKGAFISGNDSPKFILQDLVGMSSEAVAFGSFPVLSSADVSLEG